jgi:hypothetical protein
MNYDLIKSQLVVKRKWITSPMELNLKLIFKN